MFLTKRTCLLYTSMIAMAVTMISGTSLATVYANANPPAAETTTEVVQETSTEITEDTEKKERCVYETGVCTDD